MFILKITAVTCHIRLCDCIFDASGWIYSAEPSYSQLAQIKLPSSKPNIVSIDEAPNLDVNSVVWCRLSHISGGSEICDRRMCSRKNWYLVAKVAQVCLCSHEIFHVNTSELKPRLLKIIDPATTCTC
jgi:hypothetical protein